MGSAQGDQFVLIFAYWAVFEKLRKLCINFDEKWIGLYFKQLFSKTPLVTLVVQTPVGKQQPFSSSHAFLKQAPSI
jgi:hypothetical protein